MIGRPEPEAGLDILFVAHKSPGAADENVILATADRGEAALVHAGQGDQVLGVGKGEGLAEQRQPARDQRIVGQEDELECVGRLQRRDAQALGARGAIGEKFLAKLIYLPRSHDIPPSGFVSQKRKWRLGRGNPEKSGLSCPPSAYAPFFIISAATFPPP
jgi:hypothetical protein